MSTKIIILKWELFGFGQKINKFDFNILGEEITSLFIFIKFILLFTKRTMCGII